MLPIVHAKTISDAVPLSQVLQNVLVFLLSIAGALGIIGLVIAGVLYLGSAGDPARIRIAKQAALGSVIGLALALGALILITQIEKFFR
jgi:hypothetical protein